MEVTIKTKFDIGDTVYIIHQNRIVKAKVHGLTARCIRNKLLKEDSTIYLLTYYSVGGAIPADFQEERLFATKEELLKHLGKDE